jgi:hypothetical protein
VRARSTVRAPRPAPAWMYSARRCVVVTGPYTTALPGTPAMMATLLITAPSAARAIAHGALGALAHIRDAGLGVARARRH